MVGLRITVTKERGLPNASTFDKPEVKIGRTKANDLMIADPGVSSRHALVLSSGDGIKLVDLGSANGTFVNGERIRGPTPVHPGDEVYICSYRLDFELTEPEPRPDGPPPLDGQSSMATTFDALVSVDGDEPFVARLFQALELAGLRPWLDQRASDAGALPMEQVLRAGVQIILVFVGARGFAFPERSSRPALLETSLRHSTPVVGIMLPDAAWQWLPRYVDEWSWLDLRDESTWEWGLETLTAWAKHPTEVPPSPTRRQPRQARPKSALDPPLMGGPRPVSPAASPAPWQERVRGAGLDLSSAEPEPPPLLVRPLPRLDLVSPLPAYSSAHGPSEADWVEVHADAPPDRQVNLGFSKPSDGTPRSRDSPLDWASSYLFWLEIGPLVEGAIQTQAIVLPKTAPEGAIIDVVLFGEPGGFEIGAGAGRLVLEGARSRVLVQPTLRSLAHLGRLPERRLFFEVRTPSEPGLHHFSCNLYHRGVLLQSIDVSAEVQPLGVPRGRRGPALTAMPRHVLTRSLADDLLLANREHVLSIVQGRSRDGDTHTFHFFGDQTANGCAHIDDHLVQGLLDMARKAYREVSWGNDEPYDSDCPDVFRYRYDDDGDFVRLEQDLVCLAKAGFRSWDRVAQSLAQVHGTHLEKRALRERMLAPGGRIQFGLHDSPRSILPLALFYDHKLQASATSGFRLCPTFRRTLNEDPLETPCFREPCEHHDDPLTVCPSGFWGFRHAIGFTPSMGTRELCPVIAVGPSPVVHAVVWVEPDLRLRDAHVEALRRRFPGSALEVAEYRGAAIELLERGGSPLVYFYCHGGANDVGPYLRVGRKTDDPIEPSDFANLTSRWTSPRPLVFINGCHTTNLEPERALEFVSALVEHGAVGVMGTEITVFEPLATRFAETFFASFASGTEAGEAVRLSRLELLGRSLNPLGLLYVPYMLSTIRMARASA